VVVAAGVVVVVVGVALVVGVVVERDVDPALDDDATALPDVEATDDDPVVVVVELWCVEPPATATPMPTVATTAATPTATVARRIRTRDSSRARVASLRGR
jgi:hypothetical protein